MDILAHIYAHAALVRKSQSIGQNDPSLSDLGRQGQLSHRCRVGAGAILPPYLTRPPKHPRPESDRLAVRLANMSPLLKTSTPGRVDHIFVDPAYNSVT